MAAASAVPRAPLEWRTVRYTSGDGPARASRSGGSPPLERPNRHRDRNPATAGSVAQRVFVRPSDTSADSPGRPCQSPPAKWAADHWAGGHQPRKVLMRAASRIRRSFVRRGCTLARSARASASSYRNATRRSRRSASDSPLLRPVGSGGAGGSSSPPVRSVPPAAPDAVLAPDAWLLRCRRMVPSLVGRLCSAMRSPAIRAQCLSAGACPLCSGCGGGPPAPGAWSRRRPTGWRSRPDPTRSYGQTFPVRRL